MFFSGRSPVLLWTRRRSHFENTLAVAGKPLDHRATSTELFLDMFETTVEMINAIDHCFAFGRERRDDKRHGRAKIRRHHRRALEFFHPFDHGGIAIELYVGAESDQFLNMHEP